MHVRLRRVLVTTAAALTLAAAAPPSVGAQDLARVAPDPRPGDTIHLAGGDAAKTSLYRLMVAEDASVHAYCADISTSVNRSAAYTESSWDTGAAPRVDGSAPGALSWITAHSFPEVDLERLRRASGVDGLDRRQAIAATQAAVWHHTNGVDLDRDSRDDEDEADGEGAGNAAAALELYDYLLKGAREGLGTEPQDTLALTPGRVEGADPAKAIGPLTVSTTSAGPVAVWVSGARDGRLTGTEGADVDLVDGGEKFYLRLPPDTPAGVATVYARVSDAVVHPGRLFTGKDGVRTQPLVAADFAVTEATAAVKVDWVPDDSAPGTGPGPTPSRPSSAIPDDDERPAPPSPSARPATEGAADAPAASPPVEVAHDRRPDDHLAGTGTWLGTVLIIALALAAAGAAALYSARRRGQ